MRFVHLVYTITLPTVSEEGETLAIDLGMKNLAATACTDVTTSLKKYLPEQGGVSWISGCLAQPSVNRLAWRNTRPEAFAHESGTWQKSLPHLKTESAVAWRSRA